jgi:hypothetical protein
VYTDFIADQLTFAHNKGLLGDDLIELGNCQFMTSINRYIKTKVPGYIIASTTSEMFSRLQVGSYTNYPSEDDIPDGIQASTVCSWSWLQTRFDAPSAWRHLHEATKVEGCIMINQPIGLTGGVSPASINSLIHIAHSNKYECPFFAVSNPSRQFIVKIDSSKYVDDHEMKEILYKFRETSDLRVGVIFKKMSDETFKY